eukprot:scaffold7335_cov417-Prasinococcus_capsulatus_cf.AAC.19
MACSHAGRFLESKCSRGGDPVGPSPTPSSAGESHLDENALRLVELHQLNVGAGQAEGIVPPCLIDGVRAAPRASQSAYAPPAVSTVQQVTTDLQGGVGQIVEGARCQGIHSTLEIDEVRTQQALVSEQALRDLEDLPPLRLRFLSCRHAPWSG